MRHAAIFILVVAALSSCAHRDHSRYVECTAKYAVTTQRIEVLSTTKPYEVASVPVGERFAFKGVLRDVPSEKATLNLYVYDRERGGEILLQEVKYVAPFPTHVICGACLCRRRQE